MMMLKTYIIEDEPKAIALLKNYVTRIPLLNLIGATRNSLEGFAFLQKQAIDLLCLDINMPNLSGLELYRGLENPPAVVFTTAYPEFALDGFDVEAVDYLVKPIAFARFSRACHRAAKRQQVMPVQNVKNASFRDIIYIKSGAVRHKVNWRDIFYLEKDENYIIYHRSEKRILCRQTMSDLEDLFPYYICRIHKSFAVSFLHIQQIEREHLVLNKGQKLPIGRTYRNHFFEKIEQFSKRS